MRSVEHTKAFEVAVPASELFPLFSAEGETYWVPGWTYQNLMGTTELSEDYVFLTRSHDHGTTEAIWLVKRFEPAAYLVEFYKVEPGDKVGVVKVRCLELAAERTRVEVTYKYIALSPVGERFIAGFTASAYDAFIGEWETLLSAYLASES